MPEALDSQLAVSAKAVQTTSRKLALLARPLFGGGTSLRWSL